MIVGTCSISSLTVKYKFSVFFGEPMVNVKLKWTAASGTSPTCLSSVPYLELGSSSGTKLYWKILSEIPRSGKGYGMSMTDSPAWDDFFCNKDGSNCLDENAAKSFYKAGFQVTGIHFPRSDQCAKPVEMNQGLRPLPDCVAEHLDRIAQSYCRQTGRTLTITETSRDVKSQARLMYKELTRRLYQGESLNVYSSQEHSGGTGVTRHELADELLTHVLTNMAVAMLGETNQLSSQLSKSERDYNNTKLLEKIIQQQLDNGFFVSLHLNDNAIDVRTKDIQDPREIRTLLRVFKSEKDVAAFNEAFTPACMAALDALDAPITIPFKGNDELAKELCLPRKKLNEHLHINIKCQQNGALDGMGILKDAIHDPEDRAFWGVE